MCCQCPEEGDRSPAHLGTQSDGAGEPVCGSSRGTFLQGLLLDGSLTWCWHLGGTWLSVGPDPQGLQWDWRSSSRARKLFEAGCIACRYLAAPRQVEGELISHPEHRDRGEQGSESRQGSAAGVPLPLDSPDMSWAAPGFGEAAPRLFLS